MSETAVLPAVRIVVAEDEGIIRLDLVETLREEGYVVVDEKMRVQGVGEMYAAGDATSFPGPKMGHMAVHQALVAATNLAAEIRGQTPTATYQHEMRFILDEGGGDSLYVRQRLTNGEPAHVRQGLFWHWAKRVQQKAWLMQHS